MMPDTCFVRGWCVPLALQASAKIMVENAKTKKKNDTTTVTFLHKTRCNEYQEETRHEDNPSGS